MPVKFEDHSCNHLGRVARYPVFYGSSCISAPISRLPEWSYPSPVFKLEPLTTTWPCIAVSTHSPDGALVTDNQNAKTKALFCHVFYSIKCHHSFPKYSVLCRESTIILMLRENRRLYRRLFDWMRRSVNVVGLDDSDNWQTCRHGGYSDKISRISALEIWQPYI